MTDTEKPRGHADPLTLETRLARYLDDPRPKRRKRLVHRLNFAFGHALTLRGAAKKAKLTGLKKFEQYVPGYAIPAAAQDALDKYAAKENASA